MLRGVSNGGALVSLTAFLLGGYTEGCSSFRLTYQPPVPYYLVEQLRFVS